MNRQPPRHDRQRRSCRQRRTSRRGAALLVCTLAAAVIALSATAILRAQHRAAVRTRNVVQTEIDRQAVLGLEHCAIARLRGNPGFSGDLYDADFGNSARVTITPVSATETLLLVWLHPTATQPALVLQIDPTTL